MTAKPLSRPLIFVMALATGVIVANLYYLQPLLHQVQGSFAISTPQASSLITLIQLGYAAGLAFVVPLGDVIPRRRLVVTIFTLAALAMLTASFVHSFVLFALLTVVIGLSSVGGQVMIPLAADFADEDERGRVVALLMSGLLMGILLSRTFSGALSEAIGWRGVYVSAAVVLALGALVLGVVLPSEPGRGQVQYGRLVLGSFALLVTYRALRHRAWLGAMSFAGFSVLWSTLAFELSGPPFHYSSGVIGLFGLLGVAGVLAANAAGREADRDRSHRATVVASMLMAVSFAVVLAGRHDVWLLGLGIVLLDTGVQGMAITNQSIIYALAPDRRSRINSAYMVCYFLGGSAGSFAAGFAYAHDGWTGTCLLGLVIAALTLVPALAWRPATTSVG